MKVYCMDFYDSEKLFRGETYSSSMEFLCGLAVKLRHVGCSQISTCIL